VAVNVSASIIVAVALTIGETPKRSEAKMRSGSVRGGDRAGDECSCRALARRSAHGRLPQRDRAHRARGRSGRAQVPGTRVHSGAGFTGNGVGPTWIAAGQLASLALGEEAKSSLARRKPALLPPEPLRSLGARLVRSALLAIDDAECAGKRAPVAARAVARLPELLGLRVATR
jgi:hypothetical protein